MSDFEDTFGSGADSVQIISSLSNNKGFHRGDVEHNYSKSSNEKILRMNPNFYKITIVFNTFKTANTWAKSNKNKYDGKTLKCKVIRVKSGWLFEGIAYLPNQDWLNQYIDYPELLGLPFFEIEGVKTIP